MADPFVAEIRILPTNFAPRGWAFCNGQLMPISQNTALFSLLGTTYGGDGRTTFGLPDLQGRTPMHPGQGPGLSLHDLGEQGGSDSVTLLQSEMPPHRHALVGQATPLGGVVNPTGNSLNRPASGNAYSSSTANQVALSPLALGVAGSSFPHNNLMPYLTLSFCIALQGVYPPRS
jgi:microcystin-dependent protein